MKQPLISVIVPVYNVEQYLKVCVDSICDQTYQNLEILLIDDGSPDRSGEMCDQIAKEDPRIRVIHKENGGLSSARNTGLDEAKGEYVSFVDSDDWIDRNMYEHLYSLMQQHNAQVAAGGLQTSTGIHFNLQYPAKQDIEVYSRIGALREVTRNQKITNSFCDKLWNRCLFDTVRFPIGELYEDMKTIPKCLEQVDTVVYDPSPMYFYRMTNESITRGQFRPRMFEEAYAAKKRAEYYAEKYPEIVDAAIGDYIRTSIMKVWMSRGTPDCKEQRKALIKEMRGKFPKAAVKSLSRNGQIKLYALRMGLPIFYLAMWLNDLRVKNR